MKRALLIGSLFFVSGLTSLVYQSLWIRVLSLGVGSTSTSMSIVLSIFFAGLSLGSWWAGKIAARIQRPVLWYGVIEGVIGLYSLVLLPILFSFHAILAHLPLTGTLSWLGTALKFGIVLVLLIIPTTLMGASLPILVRIFVKSTHELGRRISLLYGINTLGAVAGAFLAGFLMIPSLGIVWSNTTAAALNILILLAAIILQKREREQEMPLDTSAETVGEKVVSNRFSLLLPWVAFGTGFSSLAAEVVWNKYLGIFLGSNVFGLSLILTLFLLGIALGSLCLSLFVDKIKDKQKLFQWLLLACFASIFITTKLLNAAPVLANVAAYYLPSIDLFIIKASLAALVLFPPGAVLGALLPLAIRLKIENVRDSAAVAGRLYALNTLGSILGSCAAGLLLIPALGSSGALLVALSVLLLLNLAVAIIRRKRGLGLAVVASVHLLALAALPFVTAVKFENIIKSAYVQQAASDLSFSEVMRYFARDYEDFKLIVEGKTGIISLSHDPQDGPQYKEYLRLKTNGLNESIYDTKNLEALPKYEALLGFLPLALARNPESAFVVGYGGGYTVDFLTSTDIDQVFVAELEEGILKAADYVYQGNNPLLARKNLKLKIEDARFLLAAKSHGPFDIIVSQPSHSWLAGVANLFTEEFFLVVKDNLTETGVFSQWLNLYNMNPEVLKSILHTFFSVFPHGHVFTGAGDQELILIGSRSPVSFEMNKLSSMAANQKYKKQLIHVPIDNAYDVLSQYALSRKEVLELTTGARTNTDRNAYAEVTQSRLFYSQRNSFPSKFLLEAFSGDFSNLVSAGEKSFSSDFYKGILRSLEKEAGRSFKSAPLLDRLLNVAGGADAFEIAYQSHQMERYRTAEDLLTPLLKKDTNQATFHLALMNYLQSGKMNEAKELWTKHPRFQTGAASCFAPEMHFLAGDLGKAATAVAQLEGQYEKSLEKCGAYLNKSLGKFYFRQADPKRAIAYLESYYSAAPGDVEAYRTLLAAYILTGDAGNAQSFFPSLEYVEQEEKSRLEALASQYEQKGFSTDAEVLRKIANAL